MKQKDGRQILDRYYRSYAAIARDYGLGFVLESATWRASSDWGKKLGYSGRDLSEMNHRAIELLRDIRTEYENGRTKMVISGCMGSHGDGYNPSEQMTAQEAELDAAVELDEATR